MSLLDDDVAYLHRLSYDELLIVAAHRGRLLTRFRSDREAALRILNQSHFAPHPDPDVVRAIDRLTGGAS